MIPPWLALLAWFPISLYCFWRYPIRIAILIDFLGGWAVLPTASYAPSGVPFAFWLLPSSLPANYFLTKASITGMACILGAGLFHKSPFRRFKLTFWDLPMVVWCVVPVLSGIANPQLMGEGLRGGIYQSLAWGTPYFFGRLYFSDTDSLRLAARGFVIAGLAYVPICLMEVLTGPQLYHFIYGYQPYRWIGAARYAGFRPIGLLEDGNQLGIWMATSALIAGWLWRRRSVERILHLPIAWVAILLFAVTLLCQSTGSILLLICLLSFVFIRQRYLPRTLTVVLLLGILSFAGLRLTNVVSLRALVKRDPTAHAAARFLKTINQGSLGWRLDQDELHVGAALQEPILGSGEWDWWRGGTARPWGLWLLAFGMYGMVGLLALESLQLLPVARVVWSPLARSDIQAFHLRHALAAAILMSAIDNLFNSSMLLPLLLVIGGMSTWTSATSSVPVEIQERAAPRAKSPPKEAPVWTFDGADQRNP